MENINGCHLCPRNCGADRITKFGYCKMPADIYAARAALHFWEEPCISGNRGSGAVFFTGCPLGCVYCQNTALSAERKGKKISSDELRIIFKKLESQGAHNINLVTPSHFAPAILQALDPLPTIPVVYNCGGYESMETLKMFEGKASIYLPDMKYSDSTLAAKYSNAPDYFEVCRQAILEMYRQTGPFVLDENGIMKSGVIIRHLILPGNVKNSFGVLQWIADSFPKGSVMVSLMGQYVPNGMVQRFPELCRGLKKREYERVEEKLYALGIEDGYVQELSAASESFLPEFDFTGLDV